MEEALKLGLDPLEFILILQNQAAAERTISDTARDLFSNISSFLSFRLTYDRGEYRAVYDTYQYESEDFPEYITSIEGVSDASYWSYTFEAGEKERHIVTFNYEGDLITPLNYLAQQRLNSFGYWTQISDSFQYMENLYQLQLPLGELTKNTGKSLELPEELKHRIISYGGRESELRTLLAPSEDYLVQEILHYRFDLPELILNLEKRQEILETDAWYDSPIPSYLYLTGDQVESLTYLYEIDAMTYSVIDNNSTYLLIEDGLLKFSSYLF